MNIGTPGHPLALYLKKKSEWVVQVVEVITEDHDIVIKSNLVSTVTFDIDIPNNPNLGSFFNGNDHVGVRHSATLPTSDVRKEMEIGLVMMKKLNKSMFLFINTDGGGDRNSWFNRVQELCLWLARKYDLQKITCAKLSFLHELIMPNLKS